MLHNLIYLKDSYLSLFKLLYIILLENLGNNIVLFIFPIMEFTSFLETLALFELSSILCDFRILSVLEPISTGSMQDARSLKLKKGMVRIYSTADSK